MKRERMAALVVAASVGWASLIPAHAAPPTVTPSPGYDARLQEQRAASRASTVPIVKPASPRRGKKTHAH